MFKRLTRLAKAKLSGLLDRAEQPDEILDYSHHQQVERLYGMRRDVAALVTAKKRVAQLRDRREAHAQKLEAGARQALELGREDLARQALERRRLLGEEIVGLSRQIAELERQQAALVKGLASARSRLEEQRVRHELTKAQYAAAKAQLAISDAATGISSQLSELGLRIERTVEKVEEMNVRAGALEELERTGVLDPVGSGEDDIDRQLRLLGAGPSVDAELSRMKQEIERGRRS